MPPCLIGMEACVGAHHLSRKLRMLGHDARLLPAKYVRPTRRGRRTTYAMQRQSLRRSSAPQ
jgi:transposase